MLMVELFDLPFQMCDCFDSPMELKAYFENTATLNSQTISFLSLLCFSSLVISISPNKWVLHETYFN